MKFNSNFPTKRINELKELNNGWLNGQGIKPSEEELDWLCNLLVENYPSDLPNFHLYPTIEGGVQIEWILDPIEISININLEKHSGIFHFLNMDTNEDEMKKINFDNNKDIDWLIHIIRINNTEN